MKCVYCHNEVKENSVFCPYCGEKIVEEKSQAKSKKTKKVNNRIIIIVAMIVVTIVLVCVFLKLFYNPVNRTMIALKEEKYEKAINIYKKNISGDYKKISDLSEKLLIYSDSLREKTKDDQITVEELDTLKDAISEMGLVDVAKKYEEIIQYATDLKKSHEYYSKAVEMYDSGKYEDSINNFEKVIEDDKDYENAVNKKTDALKKYKEEITKSAEDYASKEKYDKAIDVLNGALSGKLSGDNDLEKKKSEYSELKDAKIINECKEKTAEKYNAGDIEGALEVLDDYLKKIDSTELSDLRDDYYSELFENIKEETEEKYDSDGWEAAYNYLRNYYDIFGGDNDYEELLNKYLAYQPTKLSDLDIFDGHADNYVANKEDNFGNAYMDAFYYDSSDYYNEWYISAKYKKFTGVISSVCDPKVAECNMIIYGDDVELYNTGTINAKTQPISFSIDVSGVNYLKIEFVEIEYSFGQNDFPAVIVDSGLLEP